MAKTEKIKIGEKLLWLYGFIAVVLLFIGAALVSFVRYRSIEDGALYNASYLLGQIGLGMFMCLFLAVITRALIRVILNKVPFE